MFDWLGDLFNEDSINTIRNGINTVGSFFNAASPLINAGAQLGLGVEGTRNAAKLREDSRAALTQLDQLFTPESPYAKEARRQMERKDAAAGRRSQYGTRETELAANLAKQRSSILTSPAYQALLVGANRSDYAPIGGAIGNLTGGLLGQAPQQQGIGGQQGGSGRQMGSSTNVPGANSLTDYLGGLFGPAADMAVAQGIGGAAPALAQGIGAGGMGSMGAVDSLGSLLGGNPFLPGYAQSATGIFGPAPGASMGGVAGPAGEASGAGGAIDAGALAGSLSDIIGAGLGGAGSALSGMGAGSLAGTVGATDALGGLLGGTGFLPSYGAAGGATGSGIFGSGAAAAGAAEGGAAGAGAGGAGAAGSGLGAMAGVALPAAVLIGGLMSMFQSGTQPGDISGDWAANAPHLTRENFANYAAGNPHLDALIGMSKGQDGAFNYDMFNQALQKSRIGGKAFEGQALQQAQQFGQTLAANPDWMSGNQQPTQGAWWDQSNYNYGGE